VSENHTANILQILIDRTIGQRDSITLRDAFAAEMPRGVRAFLQAEAAGWLERDLRTMPRFGRLNIDTPGVDHLLKTLLHTMAGGCVLSREEYLAALNEAVLFVENYLCRPQWTLETFLYQNAPRLNRDAVLGRLEFLADYAYFPRVLERVLRTGKRIELTAEDFRTLVARIDDEVVRQHNPRELAFLTRPIFDFFLLHTAGDDEAIPLKPLLIFFDDKKMKILTEYLESICRLRGASTITLNDLLRLLEDLYIGKGEEGTPPEASAPLPWSDGKSAASLTEGGAPSGQSADLPSAGESAEPSEPSGIEPGEPPVASAPSTGAEPETAQQLSDLTGLINPDQRGRFIRRVFRKDQAYYYGVIATLNTMRTWKEAASYLKQVYDINRLDPFAPDVVEFTDTVQKRFAAEDETPE
jgi:hypothetical protein